jgi:PAS domain S-box-containing protein
MAPRPTDSGGEQSPPGHDLHELILESVHEGVFTVDDRFRITAFNAAAERITGTPRKRALGRRCYDVFRTSICQGECAMKRTLRTGEPVRDVRVDLLDASMRTVPVRISTAVLKRRGRLIGGVEVLRDISDVEALRGELDRKRPCSGIIGLSPPMQAVLRVLPDLAEATAPVLLEGPSGTGKDLVARAIHQLGPRHAGPFVQLNCAALPDSLLESELFGHEAGAFTGAHRARTGRFRQAHRGTLFLDEIGDISPAFQAKLLRVLESGEFEPLGSTRTEVVDARIVAATHRDLAELVKLGRIREDLYYRIRVLPISLPALRERPGDIPLLVDHFVRKFAATTGKSICGVSDEAMAIICQHPFPGNVRELENGLERAMVLCRGLRIEVDHLPGEWQSPSRTDIGVPSALPGARKAQPLDRATLEAALAAHQWNRTATARALGVGRNTLWRHMKAVGLLARVDD